MGRRIDSEKRVVSRMIRLYCQRRLGLESLTEEYRALES